MQFQHMDAAESAFFLRELEHVKARTFDLRFPELKGRNLIPVSGDAGPGAETITYQQFEPVGMAELIKSYADDLPRADIVGREFPAPVRSIGASYGWSLQEIRGAAMAGRNLVPRKANAARKAVAEREEDIAATGDAVTGLGGALNNANVPAGSALTGTWTAATTADDLLNDMNEPISAIFSTTLSAEQPNTIALPPEEFTVIAQKRVPDTQVTVMEFMLSSSPFITAIEHWFKLVGAGAGSTNRMWVYDRNPDKLSWEIPQEFEQLDVQTKGLEFVVPVHARNGGVLYYYPLSAIYRDGI